MFEYCCNRATPSANLKEHSGMQSNVEARGKYQGIDSNADERQKNVIQFRQDAGGEEANEWKNTSKTQRCVENSVKTRLLFYEIKANIKQIGALEWWTDRNRDGEFKPLECMLEQYK